MAVFWLSVFPGLSNPRKCNVSYGWVGGLSKSIWGAWKRASFRRILFIGTWRALLMRGNKHVCINKLPCWWLAAIIGLIMTAQSLGSAHTMTRSSWFWTPQTTCIQREKSDEKARPHPRTFATNWAICPFLHLFCPRQGAAWNRKKQQRLTCN